MYENIDKLADVLGLSEYQRDVLNAGRATYNLGRLQKRGGVLYAPHRAVGFVAAMARVLRGARADLIGRDKMLLRARRGIRFCADGYHCVRAGRFTYYADASGQAVSREMYENATRNKTR